MKTRQNPASPISATEKSRSAATAGNSVSAAKPAKRTSKPTPTRLHEPEREPDVTSSSDSSDQRPDSFEPASSSIAHQPLDSLLPPTFDLGEQSSGSQRSQVILPTSDGGLQQIDTKTFTIQHGGKSVTLIASTPQQRARRRFIENAIAIVLAIGIIALALWILR